MFDFICEIKEDVQVNIRGLCQYSSIDHTIRPTSAHHDFAYHGSGLTHIIYDGTWKLFVEGSRTFASSNARRSSALLGTHSWNIREAAIQSSLFIGSAIERGGCKSPCHEGKTFKNSYCH